MVLLELLQHASNIDKFDAFSSDIDLNNNNNYYIHLYSADSILICSSALSASGGHKVSASRAAQASEARLYVYNFHHEIGD